MGLFSKKEKDDELEGLSSMERRVILKLRQFVKNSEYDADRDFSQVTLIFQSSRPVKDEESNNMRAEIYTGHGSYPEPGIPTDVEMGLDTSLAGSLMRMVDGIGERVGKFQEATGISFKESDDER